MVVSDIEKQLEITTGFGVQTVRLNGGVYTAIADDPLNQAAIDAALPGVISDIEAAEQTELTNKASADSMIAAFDTVSSPVMDKITELQGDVRTAWDNDVWDIADIFPAMRTKLMENAALYKRYRNFLRQGFNISQATFESSPTVAQQRSCYIAAIIFLNTGGYHSLMKVLFG